MPDQPGVAFYGEQDFIVRVRNYSSIFVSHGSVEEYDVVNASLERLAIEVRFNLYSGGLSGSNP